MNPLSSVLAAVGLLLVRALALAAESGLAAASTDSLKERSVRLDLAERAGAGRRGRSASLNRPCRIPRQVVHALVLRVPACPSTQLARTA